jgi:hypothetical protein
VAMVTAAVLALASAAASALIIGGKAGTPRAEPAPA